MSLFTKLAQYVFAGFDDAGNAREIVPLDAATWGTEVERSLAAFIAGGGVIFETKAQADAASAIRQTRWPGFWVIRLLQTTASIRSSARFWGRFLVASR